MNEYLHLITKENAKTYAEVTDKLCFCADITGLRVDSKKLEKFEFYLETTAKLHGFM